MNINAPTGGIRLPFMKYRETDNPKKERRLPGFEWLPNKVRNHFIAMLGEFCGTFLFLFFAFSATQVANAATSAGSSSGSISQAPNTSALLFIALAFGFSLAVNAWVFFRISGGLFNPAVTLGMCLIGAVTWTRGGLVFISQILGSLAASGVTSALFPGQLNVSTTLGGGTSVVRGLFIEMFLTSELVFSIFMLAAEKHKGTFLAPIGIGLALFIAELTGVYFTGGSLNPARSFGPCVVLHSFPGYHWIYWLGPFLGSILAVAFYRFIKVLEYETANPGQDFNDKEAEVFNVDEDNALAADVARPNVAIGRSDFIADDQGIHRSHDLRDAGGGDAIGAAKSPARYDGPQDMGTTRAIKDYTSQGKDDVEMQQTSIRTGSVAGRGSAQFIETGGDYDRTSAQLPRTSGGHHDYLAPSEINSAAAYARGPSAEDGRLGGSYRVSGL